MRVAFLFRAKYCYMLHRRSMVMFFEKPSLRTHISFEVGMSQLGGHAVYYHAEDELQGKKESLADTSRVVSRYCHAIVARVKSRKEIVEMSKYATVPVINALDDYAHPCQILSDLFTIQEQLGRFKTLEDWKSLKLAYVGDCKNNVTYDLMRAAAVLGFSMRVGGPEEEIYTVEPEVLDECKKICGKSGGHVQIVHDAVEAVKGVDVIYTDSWMSYGIPDSEKKKRIKALGPFQVTSQLLSYAKKDVIFMNCLPAMRDMEQTASVLDGDHSVVFDQAENRIHVQKAILSFFLSPNISQHRPAKKKQRIVVALGGNALTKPESKNTVEEQFQALERTCQQIAQLLEMGHEVVVTHGNGPQVGMAFIQNEEAKDKVPAMPLNVCDAETQGSLGFMIQNRLREELIHRKIEKEVVSIVTETEVDANDKAFKHPTKPIGPYYKEEQAKKMEKEGKKVVEDSGRGWRVVVPSPIPKRIVQEKSIKAMVENGFVAICAGGGGIPVVKEENKLKGVDAVIDKDLSAKCLAVALKADLLLILTDVDCAYLNYKDKNKRTPLKSLSVKKAKKLIEKGEFAEGSMLPKMEACVEFVEQTGKQAIITSLDKAVRSVNEQDVGTHFTSED